MKVINDKPTTYAEIEQALEDGHGIQLSVINQYGEVVDWSPISKINRAWEPGRYRIIDKEETP